MMKTIDGVKSKLTTAQSVGYKYCIVSVDGHNIGCAVINDILGSLKFCRSPKGKIRTFIHRGYEYTVEKGIEINLITDEDFMEHYMGVHRNKELRESIGENKVESILKRKLDTLNEEIENLHTSLGEEEENDLEEDEEDDATTVGLREPMIEKQKEGILKRIKNWLKGDIGYKR